MKYYFKALIYKTGINWCVDVPAEITSKLIVHKGYIKIKGTINSFEFSKSLVPVKGSPYRLFVNLIMMKGGKTAVGEIAGFEIEQDTEPVVRRNPVMHDLLKENLKKHNLSSEFDSLTPSRKRDILSYLHSLKNKDTIKRNIAKVIDQLKKKIRDTRIP